MPTPFLILAFFGAASTASQVSEWSNQHLVEVGVTVAKTVCGDKGPTAVEESESPYFPGVVDRIETRRCAGGESRIFFSPMASDPTGLPVSVFVRSASVALPGPIRIGQSSFGIVRYLGWPHDLREGRFTYLLTESEDALVIETRGGVIVSVSWQFYTG